MRALVTGATGFIGSHLVKKLVREDFSTAVIVRPGSDTWRIRSVADKVTIIQGEFNSIENSNDQIVRFAPEVVFHLGWFGVANRYRDDLDQINQNLLGSLKLLGAVVKAGCQRWIGLGSQAEYGRYDRIISEDFATQPDTLYGITKLSTCLLSRKLCQMHGVNFTWLRLFSTYGPFDAPQWVIPYTILKLLKGEKPALTLGEQKWDYLYVEDIAEALYKVSVNPQANGIFNLGSGKSYTVRCVVEKIRDLINPDLPLGLGEKPYSDDQIMLLQADISKLVKATGCPPQTAIEEGLERTVKWFKENQGSYTV